MLLPTLFRVSISSSGSNLAPFFPPLQFFCGCLYVVLGGYNVALRLRSSFMCSFLDFVSSKNMTRCGDLSDNDVGFELATHIFRYSSTTNSTTTTTWFDSLGGRYLDWWEGRLLEPRLCRYPPFPEEEPSVGEHSRWPTHRLLCWLSGDPWRNWHANWKGEGGRACTDLSGHFAGNATRRHC
jgi:hypothetical protein